MLWEITRACERALDAYEGFPRLYIKQRLAVALPNCRRAKPIAYVMNGPRQRDYGPASDGYLASIADGYRAQAGTLLRRLGEVAAVHEDGGNCR